MIALTHVIDAKLGEMVAMAPTEHFLGMAQVAHHGNDMVLDIAQIEADLAAGSDGVLFVAALGETFDDVCFSAEEAHERHDFLAAFADLAEERGEVVVAGDEDLVVDLVGFDCDGADDGFEAVDDVVAVLTRLVRK